MLFGSTAFAQVQNLDVVAENLKRYHLQNNHSTLFIHFDKNVYTNNDQVWFTGYLLRAAVKSDQYHTLYLSLVNNADSSVVLQEKFPVEEGISFGSLVLPDSLPGGSYCFVANTNIKLDGYYDGEFKQPITIKSTTFNPLEAKVSVFKTYDEKTQNGTALLKVLSSENRFVENAEIQYQIGQEGNVIRSGKAKSSVIGELMIDYPANQITEKNNLLHVSVRKGKDVRYLKFNLPIRNFRKYSLSFYPEGGYLVDRLKNKVGFEIKDESGNSIRGKAVLYDYDKIIDTISTNSTGIGSFIFQPEKNKRIYARILGANDSDQFDLPPVQSTGLVLRTRNAIADDDLRIQIESNIPSKNYVIIHDFSTIHLQSEFELKAFSNQDIRFKLDSVPTGLYAVTVLNQDFKPVAERIFFAHYDQINRLKVTTEKNEYDTRDSVQVNISALGKADQPMLGLVSVSCVQANRLSLNNSQNITDYYFYQRLLSDLPQHLNGIKYTDKSYLENILLVKGWRKYKWPAEALRPTPLTHSTMEFTGVVSKNKKQIKTPMVLNTIAGTNINTLTTDNTGHFNIPISNLLSTDKGKVWLTLSDKRYYNYDVTLNDPMIEIKKHVVSTNYKSPLNGLLQLDDNLQSITISSGIKLKEVVIKSKKDDQLDFALKGANSCGDYVCKYNILNCNNHRGDFENRNPIQGNRYNQPGVGSVVYQGCTENDDKPNLRILKGISLAKDFYQSDISDQNEPINFATVYWNYQVAINGKAPAKLLFNTGDLTGKFKIIVQGITSGGVAYGEKEIIVKNRKSP